MRLRHIEVFHAVYTCGSITAAARRMGVSQPSVSKVLAHAEQQLGYPLFERLRGKLVPTREAERLIGPVSRIYRGIDEVQKVARNLAVVDHKRIRLAATPAFGIGLVPSAISRYLEEQPDIRFETETLHCHQVVRALNQSRVDLGVVFHSEDTAGVHAERVASGRFVAVVHPEHALAGQDAVSLEEVEGQPFIGLSLRGPLGRRLRTLVENFDERFAPLVLAETCQMAMSLVARGVGLTLVDEITARSMEWEQLRVLRLATPLDFEVALLRSEAHSLPRPAEAFADYLWNQVEQFLSTDLGAAA